MIPKKPALGLDPRVATGFRKRSCASKKLERDDDSTKTHPALETVPCRSIGRSGGVLREEFESLSTSQ